MTIYWQANPSRRLNPRTGKWKRTGKVFDEYLLAYYQGTRTVTDKKTSLPKQLPKLVREKFGDLKDAEIRARDVVNKLANLQGEALKLTNLEALAYAGAMRELRQWKPDVSLALAVTDYVSAMRRLPEGVALQPSSAVTPPFTLTGAPASAPTGPKVIPVAWQGQLKREQWNLFSLKVLTRLAQADDVEIEVKVRAKIKEAQTLEQLNAALKELDIADQFRKE